jgi:PadR family transcriptional regulator, regulatory protein PadR
MDAHHPLDGTRGWARPGTRRGRWIEPFVLLLLAEEVTYGWALIGKLNELGVASDGVDVGMVYRTLRELDAEGLVSTEWGLETGPPRRDYRLTPKGRVALDTWVAVMTERRRLISEFLDRRERLGVSEGG